jgi:DNA-binding transcriptional MerR regulator
MNRYLYQQGGAPGMQGQADPQEQIMQIIQMFAQLQGVDPQQIIQQLQQMQPEEQKQMLQQMIQTVQQAQGAQQPEMSMRGGGGVGRDIVSYRYGGGWDRRLGAKYQEGGSPEQDQISQIIQMFAQMQGIDPQEIIQQLQQMSPEEQQAALQEMVQAVQQGQGQQQMSPEEEEMMMREGGWVYSGYMNHPMMSFGQNQHSVILHQMGGPADSKGGLDRRLGAKYEEGGDIKIDARKKGTFKAQATKMGMSVMEAANHILKNKNDYSPTMVRKANFARNFAKEFGGQLDERDFTELI